VERLPAAVALQDLPVGAHRPVAAARRALGARVVTAEAAGVRHRLAGAGLVTTQLRLREGLLVARVRVGGEDRQGKGCDGDAEDGHEWFHAVILGRRQAAECRLRNTAGDRSTTRSSPTAS